MTASAIVDEQARTSSSSNHLLDRIPAREREKIDARLEPVNLDAGHVLYEPGDPMTHVYFPTSGMIAMIAVMKDGRTTESATVGREGAAGMSASGYVDPAFTRHVVQLPTTGYRAAAADFENMIDESVTFCSAVVRWREVLLRATLQSVACNSLHDVRQRCSRWILTTHDRTELDQLPLTQEFLAEMLGVKRNAINIVARELQSIGLIEYKRGRVTVIDREGLREVSCECYDLIRAEITKLFNDGPSSECDD